MRKALNIGVALIALSSLAACQTATKRLGITKNAPNEFNILTKPPLVVPPEFNLRPPELGASTAENNYTQEAARQALIGDIDDAEPTRGEIVLMTKAGVGTPYRFDVSQARQSTASRLVRSWNALQV